MTLLKPHTWSCLIIFSLLIATRSYQYFIDAVQGGALISVLLSAGGIIAVANPSKLSFVYLCPVLFLLSLNHFYGFMLQVENGNIFKGINFLVPITMLLAGFALVTLLFAKSVRRAYWITKNAT